MRILLTQNKFAIVGPKDYAFLTQWKWYYDNTGYAARGRDGGGTISMHRQILGTPKGMETDHKDTNTLNNQRYNLENCTKKENLRRKYNR